MEDYNLEGAPLLGRVPRPPHLGIPAVKGFIKEGHRFWTSGHRLVLLLPIFRKPFHLAGWYSSLCRLYLDYERQILLVDDFNLDTGQIVRNLIRLGYDRIEGFLAGGFASWLKNGQDTDPSAPAPCSN